MRRDVGFQLLQCRWLLSIMPTGCEKECRRNAASTVDRDMGACRRCRHKTPVESNSAFGFARASRGSRSFQKPTKCSLTPSRRSSTRKAPLVLLDGVSPWMTKRRLRPRRHQRTDRNQEKAAELSRSCHDSLKGSIAP